MRTLKGIPCILNLAGSRIELRLCLSEEDALNYSEINDDYDFPFWVRLWPSGIALALHLSQINLAQQTVLELGAGLALPSRIALSKGAECFINEVHGDALAYLQTSLPSQRAHLLEGHFKDLKPDFSKIDYLIASDIVYEKKNWPALFRLFSKAIASSCVILLADPMRKGNELFFEELKKHQMKFEVIESAADGVELCLLQKISLFRIY